MFFTDGDAYFPSKLDILRDVILSNSHFNLFVG